MDEAARDTKLRSEQLEALENESFDDLGDAVYARAMLRTYAQYLGLKPDAPDARRIKEYLVELER